MSAIRNCTVYLRNAAILNIDAVIQDWYKNELPDELFCAIEDCASDPDERTYLDGSASCKSCMSLLDDICYELADAFAERVVNEWGPEAVLIALGYSADDLIRYRNENWTVNDVIVMLLDILPNDRELIVSAGISYNEIHSWIAGFDVDLQAEEDTEMSLRGWASSQGYN